MEHSPSSEANCSLPSQEIPLIVRNPEVHYCVHKNLPLVPILSQIKPVHFPTFYFLKTHFNVILPSMRRSPTWSPCLRFPPQTFMHLSSSPICATCSAHLILLDLITWKILVYTALGKKSTSYLQLGIQIFNFLIHNLCLWGEVNFYCMIIAYIIWYWLWPA